jgi:hypothetical protein
VIVGLKLPRKILRLRKNKRLLVSGAVVACLCLVVISLLINLRLKNARKKEPPKAADTPYFLTIGSQSGNKVRTNSEALVAMEKRLAGGEKFGYQEYSDLAYLYSVNDQSQKALEAYEKAKQSLDPADPQYKLKLEIVDKNINDIKGGA